MQASFRRTARALAVSTVKLAAVIGVIWGLYSVLGWTFWLLAAVASVPLYLFWGDRSFAHAAVKRVTALKAAAYMHERRMRCPECETLSLPVINSVNSYRCKECDLSFVDDGHGVNRDLFIRCFAEAINQVSEDRPAANSAKFSDEESLYRYAEKEALALSPSSRPSAVS